MAQDNWNSLRGTTLKLSSDAFKKRLWKLMKIWELEKFLIKHSVIFGGRGLKWVWQARNVPL